MTPEEHSELLVYARTINRGDATGRQLQSWLDAHPPVASVPLAELVDTHRHAGDCEGAIRDLIVKYTPQPPLPPNPHQQGTYLWAREEHRREHNVQRKAWAEHAADARSRDIRIVSDPTDVAWSYCQFTDADFTATDWEGGGSMTAEHWVFSVIVLGGVALVLAMVRLTRRPDRDEVTEGITRLAEHGMTWKARAEAAEAVLSRVGEPVAGWEENKITAFRARFWTMRHSPWRRRTRSRKGAWEAVAP